MHYTGTIWRPPYEASSLLLQVTAGCTHHRCKFCALYADLPFQFRMSPLEDIEADLMELRGISSCLNGYGQMQGNGSRLNGYGQMQGNGSRLNGYGQMQGNGSRLNGHGQMQGNGSRLNGHGQMQEIDSCMNEPGFTRTFLTGANPFVLKFDRLMEIAALIRTYFPMMETIGCFARVTDVALKSDEELAALKHAGYDGLTIGMETADDEALQFMDKGYRAADIQKQCERLNQAGIRYSFFYLAGISGRGRGRAGAEATAGLCNKLQPVLIGANMLTVDKNSILYKEIRQGNWVEESETEKYEEMHALVENLEIPTIFAALGASNAFQMQGVLPEDRGRLLAVLDNILKNAGEDELRRYRKSVRHL